MGTLHGHAALAWQWARTADTDVERQRADAYVQATQDRLATVRAARAGGVGASGVSLTADEHARWVAAGRDAALSESRAARFDGLADEAAWDGDETGAGRHAWMAARCRESAVIARQEQAELLTAARDRGRRTVPC